MLSCINYRSGDMRQYSQHLQRSQWLKPFNALFSAYLVTSWKAEVKKASKHRPNNDKVETQTNCVTSEQTKPHQLHTNNFGKPSALNLGKKKENTMNKLIIKNINKKTNLPEKHEKSSNGNQKDDPHTPKPWIPCKELRSKCA